MAEFPTGTVTFLFTDIEGSTRLWEQHPDAMRLALARHDVLLRAAIGTNNGQVFKTVGDAFCAVFAVAVDAVDAALAIQKSLCSLQPSPAASSANLSLRVRVALHIGAAEAREGDYFGPALNRVARLLAVGHGGQVLLSSATRELVQDDLPPQVSLRDLGSHRLKDLQRPEHLFQLLHPDLPLDFPAPKSLDLLPNNLPRQLTSFVGREREMAEVKRLLAGASLLTLTGTGGCGKTRLALQVAADQVEQYADGVWLVELAALPDPRLVVPTVAAALEVREQEGRTLTATLLDYLRDRPLLLLLDNCEHLLPACAELAESVLRHCAKLRILATSRETLGIAGEQTYRVPSLSAPDPSQLPPVEALPEFDAVRLFIERAALSQPGFSVTPDNAAALAQVCHQLDGIPLAIELAAARVKAMPVEKLHERLSDRFRLLTGGSRTALPRHQTLRALIDWSHDLLTVPEQALLRRLSVFAGGWTLEAAETVCSGIQGDPLPVPEHPKAQTPEHPAIEPAEVIDLLASLVEKSLVVYEEQKGEGRYGLLETVRQYARDRLAEAGEAMAVREWHRAFFLRLAEEAQDGARGAPRPAEHLQQIDRERDNFLAALDECIQSGAAEEGLRVAVALWRAWVRWGYQAEGCGRVAELLALPEASARTEWRVPALGLAEELNQNLALSYAAGRVYAEEMLSIAQGLGDKHLMARALSILGRNAWRQGDYKAAEPFHERSLAIWRELEERELMTAELGSLAVCARFQGDLARARTLHEQALAIHQAMGNRQGVAFQQSELGQVALQEGDCALARALCEEADAVIRELQPEMPFWSLYRLGEIALRRGDLVKARAMHEEALALYRKRGVRRIIAFSMESLGWVSLFEGDPDRAAGDFRESLNDWCRIGDRRGIAACLEGLAKVHCRQGRANRAARLFGAAGATREASGTPIWPCDRPDYERFVAETRVSLGEETFAAAWAQGRSWPLEQAIADALADG